MSAPETHRLYAGPAPGSEHWQHTEQRVEVEHLGRDVLFNVADPTLTVYPATNPTGASVIICPGGGFHLLAYHHEGIDVARWLAARGITCAVLHYRLIPCDGPSPHVQINERAVAGTLDAMVAEHLPLAVADGRRALEWLGTEAGRLQIDPGRMGLLGFSAGATLTMALTLSGTGANGPAFIAPIYPHYGWVRERHMPDPVPPMFLAAASDDELGFATHATELYLDWLKAGGQAEMHLYERGGHGFGMRPQGLTCDDWIEHFHIWMQRRGLLEQRAPAVESSP